MIMTRTIRETGLVRMEIWNPRADLTEPPQAWIDLDPDEADQVGRNLQLQADHARHYPKG